MDCSNLPSLQPAALLFLYLFPRDHSTYYNLSLVLEMSKLQPTAVRETVEEQAEAGDRQAKLCGVGS